MQNEICEKNSEKNRTLKILYAGSPEASARTLEILLERSQGVYEIAVVLTNPPSAKGRK